MPFALKRTIFLALFTVFFASLQAQPRPSAAQLAWQDQEFYLFMHFGPNTFTGKEWGHGDEKEEIFNPSQLDCRQWAGIAKASGAKGIIITAKHHDGFCLWPSNYSTHTVRESKWRNGEGDVLKELSAACREAGLKFGVYISPWDRNHPAYGTPAYNDIYKNTMKEIFSRYGPIWELWWDGANGEGPNGKKQVYDFPGFEKIIRDISPQTVIFSDIGPDIRWVGNEKGFAGTTNWNTLETAGFSRGEGGPSTDSLTSGNAYGKNWIPAECDVSIRPGWFYHKEEDDKVKSPEKLLELYFKSVGRGASLLLNVPPDGRGLINANDSAALMGFKTLRDQFKNNLAAAAKGYFSMEGKSRPAAQLTDNNPGSSIVYSGTGAEAGLRFKQPVTINCIALQEALQRGQACKAFRLTLKDENNAVVHTINGTTIGHKRLLSFSPVKVSTLTLEITDQNFPTAISDIGAYLLSSVVSDK